MTDLVSLDLFAGIGGFALGFKRAGISTAAFVEIDPFCRRVLAKNFPGVPIYEDVRDVTAERLAAAGIVPGLVCGGFPCQDISIAGKGAGLAGERSGLWFEFHRIVGETRPRWVVIENVSVLRSRGLDRVLGGLAALGYDAEWHCIPASAVGAPHRRDRVWIVAHANDGQRDRPVEALRAGRDAVGSGGEAVADADMPHAQVLGPDGRVGRLEIAREIAAHGHAAGAEWRAEPNVGRVAHGVPRRVDRLRALGNAVVPQIPEMIGRAILAAEARR